MKSIATRVSFWALLIVGIGFSITAALVGESVYRYLVSEVQSRQLSLARLVGKEIGQDIKVRFEGLEKVAERLAPLAAASDHAGLQARLQEHATFNLLFDNETFVVDKNGIAIASISNDADRIGTNYMDRDYVHGALKEGKPMIGKPVIGRKLNAPIFALATPIRNPQGEIIGALAGVINLGKPNFISRKFEEPWAPNGGYLLTSREHRLIITGSDKTRTMTPVRPEGESPIIDAYMRGEEVAGIHINSRGVESSTAAGNVPGVPWYVVVNIPAEDAFQFAKDVRLQLMLLALGLGVLVAVLMHWLVKAQLRPLVQAAHTLQEAETQHTLPKQLPVKTMDEVGQLITGFNQAVSALSQRGQELEQARQVAESASQAKGQFLANMSHEIRTPLNAILGLLQLMRQTPLTRTQHNYVSKSLDSGHTLLGVINDILDFSKVEAGKLELAAEPFEIKGVLQQLAVIMSEAVHRKNIEVYFDIDPSAPRRLVGDVHRLQQVLINLCSNAIKFTEQGHVTLRLRFTETTSSQATVEFAVIDTGLGIAADKHDKIFEGFSQAEASTTRRYGGTGLGLAISQRFIQAMGSTITLDSVPGQGSTFAFTLTFPLAEPDAAVVGESTQMPHEDATWLICSNPASVQNYRKVFDMAGSELKVLTDVARAELDFQPNHPSEPNWILVDWRLNGRDPWELIQALHRVIESQQWTNTRILVAAYEREITPQQKDLMGNCVAGCLAKPFSSCMLSSMLKTAKQDTPTGVAAKGPVRRLAGLRLLVVEDNATNQLVAEELLSSEGALVDLAGNGEEGCQAMLQSLQNGKPYDLVLMDMQMPVMDGVTATRYARQDERLRSLPIIAMTANVMASDRQACLDAGMNGHIGKPFDLGEVVEVLLKHVARPATASHTGPTAAAAALAEAATTSHLGGVSILNTTDALARLGGAESLLQRLRGAFIQQAQQALDQLDSDSTGPDLRGWLHSLKGASLSVGADQLATVLKQAEQLAITGEGKPDMVAVRQSLALTLEALRNSQPANPPKDTPPVNTPGQPAAAWSPAQRQALEQLLEQISHNDMEVFDALDHFKNHLTPSQSNQLDRLSAALDEVDFETARLQCEALLAN